MNIELAVNAMDMSEHIDEMVFFSDNGDLRSLVEAVQRRGGRVTVVTCLGSQPAMIADELRRQANTSLDLKRLEASIGRTNKARPDGSALGDRERIVRLKPNGDNNAQQL